MFKFALLQSVATAQRAWTHADGVNILDATSTSELKFILGNLELQGESNGGVSVAATGWSQLEIAGEPDLPVMRTAMAIPRGATLGNIKIELNDVDTESLILSSWGQRIEPSKGKCPLCGPCNITAPDAKAYQNRYPASAPVTIAGLETWRDVHFVTVEVKPVSVDHVNNKVDVLRNATITLEGMSGDPHMEPLGVEPHFFDAYKQFFSNWEHIAHEYTRNEQAGRVMVIYDTSLQDQAQTYKGIVQERLNPTDIVMYAADRSSSSIQSKIKSEHAAGQLAFITIVGRDVASPTGSQTREVCDNCYVMLSGGTNLDIAIGRISGDANGVDSYLKKLKAYDSHTSASWSKKAYGTYSMVMQDERRMDQNLQRIFQQGGWTFDYKQDTQTSASESISKMEDGLGVFSYIGHGSGTAWNTPRFSVSQVESLRNSDKIFFELDVSCDNGNFRDHRPCMAEALITSRGGAIGTMMSSPTMKGTMCKRQQEQAATAITTGTANRIGMIYNIGLNKGNQITRDTYAVQAYNVFGDPTQAIIGASPAPGPTPTPSPTPTPTPTPVPTPTPTPVPTPTPTPGSCHAVSALVDDDWCAANCAAGFCPSDLCECDSSETVV